MKSIYGVLVIALGLTGCIDHSSPVVKYIIESYEPPVLTEVKREDDTYRVFEHKTLNRVMVTTSLRAAAGAGYARGLTLGLANTFPEKTRFEGAARDYLDRTNRRHCAITAGDLLMQPQWEFRFTCKGSKAQKEPKGAYVAPEG